MHASSKYEEQLPKGNLLAFGERGVALSAIEYATMQVLLTERGSHSGKSRVQRKVMAKMA